MEVIARTKGRVEMDGIPSGDRIFPIWGWLSAIAFALEFVCWRSFQQTWCLFLWVIIPLIGTPLMMRIIRKDRDRTHIRSRASKLVLDYWIFVGAACGLGGFALGFADLYEICFIPVASMLIGIGAFITGEVLRFRPMIICGLIGAFAGLLSFILQGELWSYQLLVLSLVSVVSLIVPGYLYNRQFKDGV